MSGNVGGQDGNQINIKLYNGKTVNLKKLDKLIGQSTAGSLFAKFDSADKGGNANNIFDEAEIAQIKNLLLQYQADDNTVTQNELNEMFGYGQIGPDLKQRNFDVNSLTSLLDSIPDDEPQMQQTVKDTPPPNDENQVFTKYTVQPGDTPEKLAQKFGLKGEDAEAFIKHLKTQTNKKGWFMVGQKITLLGDFSQTIENLTDYTEDDSELQQRWANTESGQKAIAAEAERRTAEARRRAEAEAAAKAKAAATPPHVHKDKTPVAQKITISSARAVGKQAAQQLKNQIESASLNSNTRKMLSTKVTNRHVAYILEAYPDLVTDIDDEWGMDINDVKKYVISPLNKRLRELGLNKKCISDDYLSKLNMSQIQTLCNETATFIRGIDKENGYVFKPTTANEGKLHYPRKVSQNKYFSNPTAQKQTNPAASNQPKPEANDSWKYISMSEMSYPQALQDKLVEFRSHGYEATVTKKRVGYRLEIKYTGINHDGMPGTNYNMNWDLVQLDKNDLLGGMTGLTKTSFELDKEGNLVTKKQEGVVLKTKTTTHYQNNKPVSTETQVYTPIGYSNVDGQRVISDTVATRISLNRPNDLGVNGNKFADSLENNKAKLMKRLNLTNEQYDNLARLAMGIAEQETHFKNSTYRTSDNNREENVSTLESAKALINAVLQEAGSGAFFNTEADYNSRSQFKELMDSIYYNDKLSDNQKEWIFEMAASAVDSIKSGTGQSIRDYYKKYSDGTKSYGMTQIKVDQYVMATDPKTGKYSNPALVQQFFDFGIKSGEDIRENPEKQAIATLLYLNNKRIQAESEVWQTRLKNNNANISDPKQQIGNNELIALLYNGSSSILDKLKEGNLKLQDAPYARNVKAYINSWYNVSTDGNSRLRADNLGVETQGNNGLLGTVIFMPTAYTTNVTNSKEDIKTLENALNNNSSIPQDLKNQLIMAAKKNEIAFGYGLSTDEAASITAADAQLMLNKLNGLKDRISNLVDPAKIREEAQTVQTDFRSTYLQSRQVVVNDHDVPAGSIIPALSSGDIVNERLEARGDRKIIINELNVDKFRTGARRSHITVDRGQYYGFGIEADKGVNPYDANGNYISERQRILAECASDVAAMMDTGNNCATGVKAALQSAGVVEDRSEIAFTDDDGSWNKCKFAKDLARYFNMHPEKFEEVKYVSLGNGTSRELNASDIKNLPAGYIGVFIPGAGYEEQAGHAFITNGNGQGYADEVDNLRWDDFKSAGAGNGKGEHGTFKIYRLKV